MDIHDIKERYISRDAKVFARDNKALRDEIAAQTKAFIEAGGKIDRRAIDEQRGLIDFKQNIFEQAQQGVRK